MRGADERIRDVTVELDSEPARSAVRGTAAPLQVHAFDGERHVVRPDRVATEEPLELRLAPPDGPAFPLTVTMRTPGHDFELAAGFLYSEGVIEGRDDLAGLRYCTDGPQEHNAVSVDLRRPPASLAALRTFATTSSCGVCGKASIDDVEVRC